MGCEKVKDAKKRAQCEEANKKLAAYVKKEKAESNFNNQNFEMLAAKRARQESLNPTPKALKKKT